MSLADVDDHGETIEAHSRLVDLNRRWFVLLSVERGDWCLSLLDRSTGRPARVYTGPKLSRLVAWAWAGGAPGRAAS